MVARALAIVHTCIYDAWMTYDDRASNPEFGNWIKAPKSGRTESNKRAAISYAAYRAAVDLFPQDRRTIFDPFMIGSLGYDPTKVDSNPTTPAGVGNAACEIVLNARHQDGSNQLGNMSATKFPYADYTNYVPLNPQSNVPVNPISIRAPNNFQPLYYPDEGIRILFPEPFLGAHWFRVISFAGPYEAEQARVESLFPVVRYASEQFSIQADELIDISAGLTDEQKMISEYWTDGPNSELPAGHWCLFAQFISERDHHTLDDDVKLFFVLTNATFDAGVAAWGAKRKFDSVRPVSAIPYLFAGKKISAWGGPGKGTAVMDGANWIPFQPTFFPSPPFPEYPSGHSAFSSAAATILEFWTHSGCFEYSVSFEPGSSRVEPGTPKSRVTLSWRTFRFAADQAGMSRRYGGLHFRSGDLAGRFLGRLVAEKVWQRALLYFGGA